MGLIDHCDQPPRKREPLPTREQVRLISDMAALEALEAEIERRAEKITVDLEMEVGDEDWDARARSALTAHRICLRHIRQQISRVRRSDKLEPPDDDLSLEKAAKKAQRAEALANAKQNEASRAASKAATARYHYERDRIALIRKMSYHMHFFEAAHRLLDKDTCARISEEANASVMQAIPALVKDEEAEAA